MQKRFRTYFLQDNSVVKCEVCPDSKTLTMLGAGQFLSSHLTYLFSAITDFGEKEYQPVDIKI